ncbi:MAG: hypothetical protein WBM44_28355 [Waterburya sp.]
MAKKQKTVNAKNQQHFLAWFILFFVTLAITFLAWYIIKKNPQDAKDIFNVILPVFASWVGTVLAFYFGRENLESANRQVWELVERLTPEQRAKASVTSIMRRLADTAHFSIPPGQNNQDIKLSELLGRFVGNISRLPIVDAENKPKYMIHESRLDKYLASDDASTEDNLEKFIAKQQSKGSEFGFDKGFVVVSEQTSLVDAKRKMENIPSCQDIFITKGGSPDEPLLGWISNVRMTKFLVA